ncbi:Gfo/Idh/MocA family protein [Salinigranum salinum]|uniref:Gfo/Idh/MocA family protein n=1 Tax=Salinigranum salinum TaxID=1364937 RepID=UPI001260BB28|nr:Gfo/Idh/MocA family oxidoreductase [Salinigranum salinum]
MTVSVGLCSVAHVHAGAYADLLSDSLPGVEFVGVADERTERGRRFAADHDIQLRSRDALFERADGVVVCSTNADRGEWVHAAADAGVDVLAEKPLGTSADEAAAITAACADAGVSLSVAMPLRHSVPARQARDCLDALGELVALSGTNRGQFPGGWFADPAESGGGAVMDHTVHVVDLVHWLTGARVTEVYAETATRFTDADVEDVNLLSMTLGAETPFSLDGSWSRPEAWDAWGNATLEITGTRGVVHLDCFAQRFRVTRDGDDGGTSSVFYGTDPNRVMLERFAETLRGADPAVPGDTAVEALAVVDAAYESAASGRAVAVEY